MSMIFSCMRSNSLLRQMVQATLSERRMQPIGADKLVTRLNSELRKLLQQPENWQNILNKMRSYTGNNDPKVIEDLAQTNVEDVAEAVRKTGAYVVVDIPLRFLAKDTQKIATKIDVLIRSISKQYGWSVLTAKHRKDWQGQISFVLEGNYSERVTRVPKTLYHVTQIWNVKNILHKGLLPKKPSHNRENRRWDDEDEETIQQGRQYPPRVYLASNKALANELVMSFQDPDDMAIAMSGGGTGGFDPYVLLRIDGSKLLPGTKLYYDDEFANQKYEHEAFWTYTRIPTAAISIDPQDQEEYQRFLQEIEES